MSGFSFLLWGLFGEENVCVLCWSVCVHTWSIACLSSFGLFSRSRLGAPPPIHIHTRVSLSQMEEWSDPPHTLHYQGDIHLALMISDLVRASLILSWFYSKKAGSYINIKNIFSLKEAKIYVWLLPLKCVLSVCVCVSSIHCIYVCVCDGERQDTDEIIP